MSEEVSWAKEQLGEMDAKWEKEKKEKGILDYYKFQKGENRFLLDITQPPELKESEYEGMKMKQHIFKGKDQDGKPVLIPVKEGSYLYKLLLQKISLGHNAFKVLRSGEKLSTRYEILDSKAV